MVSFRGRFLGRTGKRNPLKNIPKPDAQDLHTLASGKRAPKNLAGFELQGFLVVHRGVEPLTSTMRMSRANELLRANPMAVRTLTGLAIRMTFSLKTVRTGLDHPIIRNLSDN